MAHQAPFDFGRRRDVSDGCALLKERVGFRLVGSKNYIDGIIRRLLSQRGEPGGLRLDTRVRKSQPFRRGMLNCQIAPASGQSFGSANQSYRRTLVDIALDN